MPLTSTFREMLIDAALLMRDFSFFAALCSACTVGNLHGTCAQQEVSHNNQEPLLQRTARGNQTTFTSLQEAGLFMPVRNTAVRNRKTFNCIK